MQRNIHIWCIDLKANLVEAKAKLTAKEDEINALNRRPDSPAKAISERARKLFDQKGNLEITITEKEVELQDIEDRLQAISTAHTSIENILSSSSIMSCEDLKHFSMLSPR